MFLKEKINFKILKIIFFFIFLLLFCYEVSAEKSYIIIDEKKITRYLQLVVYPDTKNDQKNFINKANNRIML